MKLEGSINEIGSAELKSDLGDKVKSRESIRPSDTELPDIKGSESIEREKWNPEGRASDRVIAELPELKEQEGIEKNELISEDLGRESVELPHLIERPETGEDMQTDKNQDVSEKGDPIKNKQDGLRREQEVCNELKMKYPEREGYKILSEVYLRDKDGNIVKDPVTGEARRIDYVVIDKDGNVVDSIEVTSQTADKTGQMEKENRVRENGGIYIKDREGNLHRIPDDLETKIERRE